MQSLSNRDVAQKLNHMHDHIIRIEAKLDAIFGQAAENQEIIMTALSDALDLAEANAAKETDAEAAIEALLTDVVQQLKDASEGASPAIVARVAAVAQGIADRAARLSAAVVAGTPAAPPAP